MASFLAQRGLLAAAAVVATVVVTLAGPRPVADQRSGVVLRVPQRDLAHFAATGPAQRYLSEEEKEWLPVDTEAVRGSFEPLSDFTRRRSGTALLRVGVILAGSDSRSLHRPEVCMPGQGWTIVNNGGEDRTIDLGELGSLTVRVLKMQQEVQIGGEKHMVHSQYWYWWEGPDDHTSSSIVRTLLQMRGALLANRSSRWAYPSVFGQVALDPDIPAEERIRRCEATMAAALREWAPMMLRRYGAGDLSSEEERRARDEMIGPSPVQAATRPSPTPESQPGLR